MRSISIVFALCAVDLLGSACGLAVAAHSPVQRPVDPPAAKPRIVRIVLKSLPSGELGEMKLDGKVIEAPKVGKKTRFNVLNDRMIELVFDAMGKRRTEEIEVEIDADDAFRYENIIHVVEAVSVSKGPSGEFRQLVKVVRFGPKNDVDDPAFDLPKPKK